MNVSLYHMLLRISAAVLAVVLLFDSGLLSPITKELSQNTQSYLANAVGVGASVTPTEINTLTAELTERTVALDDREAALSEREIEVGLNTSAERTDSDVSTYILSVLLFIIIVLIVLNYALDFARERRLIHQARNESMA